MVLLVQLHGSSSRLWGWCLMEWADSFEMEGSVEYALLLLGNLLVEEGKTTYNPCGNYGEEYVNDKFELRSFCWDECLTDEDVQTPPYDNTETCMNPECRACKPNFRFNYDGFECTWYKHVGRGNRQSVEHVSVDALIHMLDSCLKSIMTGVGEQ